jgi:hypothetical protein
MEEVGDKYSAKIVVMSILFTNIINFSGSYFLFSTNRESNQTEFVKTLMKERSNYAVENMQLRESLIELQLEKINLIAAQNENTNKYEIIRESLNRMPFPAWIKCWYPKEKEFRMCEINEAYSIRYGISRLDYINKKDSDIHGSINAEIYNLNDLKVLETKRSLRSIEQAVVTSGSQENEIVYKWYIESYDGKEAVAGASVHF